MCGRYCVDEKLSADLAWLGCRTDRNLVYRTGDIYPSETASVIVGGRPELCICSMSWGLPSYQRKQRIINVRAETVLEKRGFSDGVRRRRCVIPARHFYEWDKSRNKITFLPESGEVIYMAGFYQMYEDGARFVILTTKANGSMSPVHDRMPLILEKEEITEWLGEDASVERFLGKIPQKLSRRSDYEQLSFLW